LVATTRCRGKEYVKYDPYDVGMTGLIGFAPRYNAMKNCDMLADPRNGSPLPAVL